MYFTKIVNSLILDTMLVLLLTAIVTIIAILITLIIMAVRENLHYDEQLILCLGTCMTHLSWMSDVKISKAS